MAFQKQRHYSMKRKWFPKKNKNTEKIDFDNDLDILVQCRETAYKAAMFVLKGQ